MPIVPPSVSTIVPYPAGYDANSVERAFIWGGTPRQMQWLRMPSTGMTATRAYNVTTGTLDNGGAYGSRSGGYHLEYDFTFAVREAAKWGGLDMYARYASDYYARDATQTGGQFDIPLQYFFFANPMIWDQNLFAAQWATPMLARQGSWHPIGVQTAETNTSPNSYGLPQVTPTYDTSSLLAGSFTNGNRGTQFIPIPPTRTLVLGFTGSVTGAGGIQVSTHNSSTGVTARTFYGSSSFLSISASTRLKSTMTYSGATYDWVSISLASSADTTAGTVALNSSMAQLVRTGTTPDYTGGNGGYHIDGQGHTGLMFSDDAVAETYVQADGVHHYKGLNTHLMEVQAWL